MAEETLLETTTTTTTITTITTTEDMVIETLETAPIPELTATDDSQPKRPREDESNGDGAKKQKLEEDQSVEEERLEKLEGGQEEVKKSDHSVEEERLEKLEGGEEEVKKSDQSVEEERLEKLEGGEEEVKKSVRVFVGPKSFGSSVEMFDYFYKFLHFWAPNVNLNKYEHLMLLDLLKKGHAEPEKKIGSGIQSFQVRYHPIFKSRCFFIVREDESVDDFSFRKCVDQILPLPENMKARPEVNKALGSGRGGKGGRGGGRGRGSGGGGKWRN